MEVRQALLTWFVDVRESLKGCLSRTMLKLKANELYDEWVRENPTPEYERLKFRNQWEEEYDISLRKPDKRYSIKKEDLIKRLQG